jgi:hypothetical protein
MIVDGHTPIYKLRQIVNNIESNEMSLVCTGPEQF